MFFRGLLFQKLRDNFSLAVALIIQSFFFTITHYQYYYSYYILFIFLIGLAAGLIYYITNNLRSAIYFHITYNLIWFVGFLYSIK
ncbi:MAG: CPBP family intramembrane glutamic endopeptidase [Thermodesulfobacteriota bacterium]